MKRSCPDYNTLCEVLTPLATEAWKPQLNNLALFVYGLLLAGHMHLPKIALTLPVTGTTRNTLQRLERFLNNKAIQPTLWYEGVARAVLASWKGREIELILDQTDLEDRFPLLVVALAFRKRAIPIYWRLLAHEGCSGVEEQTKLLTKVAQLLPIDTRVVLLADREYGSVGLFQFLNQQGWSFVIRMKKDSWCRMANGRLFQIGEIPLRRGTINFEDSAKWCNYEITRFLAFIETVFEMVGESGHCREYGFKTVYRQLQGLLPHMHENNISSEEAVLLVHKEANNAITALNNFAAEAFRTRGGRLGSGMGSLIEAMWVYFINRALYNEGGEAAACEIGWLADHEPNDFACVLRDAPWTSATREGELFRIEAKSMNIEVDESKAHFTELVRNISVHDQLLILTWKWYKVDEWRFSPKITDHLLCPAKAVAQLRDALHLARGGTFVSATECPDGCQDHPCAHAGEPLNASGKRERKGGPETRKPSEKVSFANNFGGLVRMLKTDNSAARAVFRAERAANDTGHEYISFIHRNFPDEELNQYTTTEWRKVAQHASLQIAGKKAPDLQKELMETTPGYQQLLRNLLA